MSVNRNYCNSASDVDSATGVVLMVVDIDWVFVLCRGSVFDRFIVICVCSAIVCGEDLLMLSRPLKGVCDRVL